MKVRGGLIDGGRVWWVGIWWEVSLCKEEDLWFFEIGVKEERVVKD